MGKEYSREMYEQAEGKVHSLEERGQQLAAEIQRDIEEHGVRGYLKHAMNLNILRTNLEVGQIYQAEAKRAQVLEAGEAEAVELNNEHARLQQKVAEALGQLAQFEKDKLGMHVEET